MDGKTCTRCLEYKTHENFTKKSVNKDGLDARCKVCNSEVKKLQYKNDPEKFKLNAKKWRDDNIEKHRTNSLNWVKNNPDKSKQNKKRNIEENLDRYETYHKEYNRRNSDKKQKYNKEYYKLNREKFFSNNSKRRAIKHSQLHPSHDKMVENSLYSIALKLQSESGIEYSIDHIWPLAKGGPHHHDNLQVIPKNLNLEKNDSLIFKHSEIKTWCDLPSHILKWIKDNKIDEYNKAISKIIKRGKHSEEEINKLKLI